MIPSIWRGWRNGRGTAHARRGLVPRRREPRSLSDVPALVLEERVLLSTITVTSAADVSDPHSGVTLRDAVNQANLAAGADTIVFDPALNGMPVALTLGELAITDSLTIQGNGARNTIVDAQSSSRVFNVGNANAGPIDLTLDGLTVRGGKTTAANQPGGGIFFFSSGALNVVGSTVSGNSTAGVGSSGGGIYALHGSVTLTGSTLSGNYTTGTMTSGGGIFSTSASIVLRNSTLSGNSTSGEQAFGGGICSMFGNISLDSSTLARNWTTGLYSSGGGIYCRSGAITLTNSILAANTIQSGGYPDVFINPVFGGIFAASHSLIGNRMGITQPAAPVGHPDADGNLIGSTTSPIDPRLAPLGNYGGPTQTLALLTDSPAVDLGGTTQLLVDQRGCPRVVGAALDMGAFEVGTSASPSTISLAIDSTTLAEAGGSATVTATLSAVSQLDTAIALGFQGTAGPADVTSSGMLLLIPAGQLTASVRLTALQDSLCEGNESLIVGVAATANAVPSGVQPVTATIVDDDSPPTVSLTLSPTKMAEGGGRSTVTAKLSTASGFDVTVTLAFTGTATYGSDYTSSGTQIVIPAGQTIGKITLTAVQDSTYEGNETITVAIASGTNATPAGKAVKATITEDDPAPRVTLSENTATIAEAAGKVVLTARLSFVSTVATTINLAYTGTATYKTDYTGAARIVIAAGQLSASITLTAKQDTLIEGPETFIVDVSKVTNGVESGIQQQTVTILDDDGGLAPSLLNAAFADPGSLLGP